MTDELGAPGPMGPTWPTGPSLTSFDVERLLSGGGAAPDTPAGDVRHDLAGLLWEARLEAATLPPASPSPELVAGMAAIASAAHAERRRLGVRPAQVHVTRTERVNRSFVRVSAGKAAAAVFALAGLTAMASGGMLPGGMQSVAHEVFDAVGIDVPDSQVVTPVRSVQPEPAADAGAPVGR